MNYEKNDFLHKLKKMKNIFNTILISYLKYIYLLCNLKMKLN